jgi:hypothetical protein
MRSYEKSYDWMFLVDSGRLHDVQRQCLLDHIEDNKPNFTVVGHADVPEWGPPTEMADDISDKGTPTPEVMYRWFDTDGARSIWAKQQFGLISCHLDYHVQPPGGIVFDHADVQGELTRLWRGNNLRPNTHNKKHYIIHISDWSPGHVWLLHDQAYTGWKAGEVMEMPWYMTHATANLNNNDRPASRLIVTGCSQD